jgi:Tfp pilus assembly protein PilF
MPIVDKARNLADQGDIGTAIALLEESIERGEESAEIAKLLATLSLRIDEVRAFQNWCHEALRINPKDFTVHLMLADYFAANGREFEAEEAREIAQRLEAATGAQSAGSSPGA